jgi:hypothetical protein
MRNKTLEDTKEAKMGKRFWALSVLAVFLFAAGTVRAQSVDEKIKSLEQELTQLKDQQVELKKEATAAAAALPEFTYRPGGGISISAADKSWGINFGFEGHYRWLFESGKDELGRSKGEMIGRRARPQFVYCINNCFYEIQHRLDNDGFGTNSALQRSEVSIHFEQINPWLPRLSFGMDGSFPLSIYRQGSGNFGAQAEYDILSRNNGLNTGRYGNGEVLNWDNIDFPTGRAQFNVGMANFGEGDDGAASNTDRKDFAVYLRVEPFAKIKNKWIQGFGIETNHWFCNEDPRSVAAVNGSAGGNASGCSRLRIQDHGDGGRQTLFQFTPTGSSGRGLNDWHFIGLGWRIGPYQLRAVRDFYNFNFAKNTPTRQGVDAQGRGWLIAHDLFLWSPKGWLTGDSTIPGSILIGQHFERTDVSCGKFSATTGCDTSQQFNRNRILLREWDIWYFLPSRISIGGSLLWYDASNLATGRTGAGQALGVFSTPGVPNTGCDITGPASPCRGKGGDWVDVMLNFRMYF